MKQAGLIYREGSPEAAEFAERAVKMILERGLEVRVLDSQGGLEGTTPSPEADWWRGLDLAVVIGGDGTLLRAAQLVNSNLIPVIGVKLGGLGFLTEVQPEELPGVLDEVVAGRVSAYERMMLEGKVIGPGSTQTMMALNEIAVTSSGLPRIIDLDATINGVFVTSFRADGLLVSTPTGSTAYCMAAGGPIVHPTMRSLTVTPVCPHTLTSRPLVIPDSAQVTISLATDMDHVRVTADSQREWPFSARQKLEIKARKSGLMLVCSPSMSYYEILRTKLRWGER